MLSADLKSLADSTKIASYGPISNYDDLCFLGQSMVEEFQRVDYEMNTSEFVYAYPEQYRTFRAAAVKRLAAKLYACGKDPNAGKKESDIDQKIYEFAFKGRAEITANEFGGTADDASPTVMMKHIQSTADFLFELEGISDLMEQVAKEGDTFANARFSTYSSTVNP